MLTPCPSCPRSKRPVPGDGPSPCRVLTCGEGPGKHEDRIGLPFQGNAGEEYNNQYLPLAGLTRRQVYTTNTVKCKWADSSDPPPDWLVRSCSQFHLKHELRMVNPDVVVLMGGVASSLLNKPIDIERMHGIPIYGASILGYRPKVVVPTLHPALGLHMKHAISEIRDDFKVLGRVLSGEYQPLIALPKPYLRIIRGSSGFPNGKAGGKLERIAVDTESTPDGKPFCITFAIDGAGGFLIYANDRDGLGKFQWLVDSTTCPIFFHNLTYDMRVCRQMGLAIPWERSYDTMMRAFHRGLPQALKTLGFRYLGWKMRDFNDVVRPHSIPKQLDYLAAAAKLDWPKPPMRLVGDGVDVEMDFNEPLQSLLRKRGSVLKGITDFGMEYRYMSPAAVMAASMMTELPEKQIEETRSVPYQPQPVSMKLNRMMLDYSKGELDDPQPRWRNWPLSQRREVEERNGPFPLHSIAYVPEEEAMEYAITDAAATYNLVEVLE